MSTLKPRLRSPALLLAAPVAAAFPAAAVLVFDLTLVGHLHEPRAEHVSQQELVDLVRAGEPGAAFELAFETGDELFETVFNALDGAGANVGRGQRFSRVPRADLTGPMEWAMHVPTRLTGPNAQACNECHNQPFDDGAGGASANVHRDPLHTGDLDRFIERNTPHLFAPGAIQRLAEEMTDELHGQRKQAEAEAVRTGGPVTVALSAKGISFGSLRAVPITGGGVKLDPSNVQGVDGDLIVRPFQWKGSVKTLRQFNRDAAHNELGMQGVEICASGLDGDGDSVADELTVGDLTAMTIYLAGQPRPVSKLELHALGLLHVPDEEQSSIRRGEVLFGQIGCAACHVPAMTLNLPIFTEPSQSPHYQETTFPAGQSTLAAGVDPALPVAFDLTRDQPDNRIVIGGRVVRLGSLETVAGSAVVRLYGDLKRHAMGSGLAEAIDDEGIAADTFLTENLWGVGSTAPYLHDGRATTLTEAILDHAGEGQPSRDTFAGLGIRAQEDLIAFLDNLILFKIGE